MYSSLQSFTSGIDGLISYIEFEEAKNEYFKDGLARAENSEFSTDFKFFVLSIISQGATNGKRFLYNSMIVSLYGYLESYLEQLIEEYISQLSADCTKYSEVPEVIREQHLEISIDLIKEKKRNRNLEKQAKATTIRRVVSNLNSCLSELENFSLNEEAFSIHSANFRYDSIHTLFCRAGINGILRLALEKDYFQREIEISNSLSGQVDKKILISLLTSQLDDLAQRRNEISHGSLNSDLQSLELFKNRAKFIKCLGIAMHEVAQEKYQEFIFPILKKFNLGKPTRIFNKINVLGYNYIAQHNPPLDLYLNTGDELFFHNENSDKKIITGKVLSLKINNAIVNQVSVARDAIFTIEVDFNITSHFDTRDVYFRA